MPPPRGGGTLYSHLNDTSQSETTLSQNFSQPDEKAAHDAAILSGGGLGLDPENDPIVATTDWGLDIKFHNAGEGTWGPSINTNGTVSTSALNGYLYFVGGTYNGVSNLKWVIIGYSTNSISASGVNPNNVSNSNVFPDTSDAGNIIKTYASRGLVYVNGYKSPIFTNAVGTTEIPAGCVLCISEKNLLNAQFRIEYNDSDADDGYKRRSRWKYSDLRITMSNLCENTNGAGIQDFDTIRGKIQTVTLNTYSYRDSSTRANTPTSDKFFPLAVSYSGLNDYYLWDPSVYPQNYLIETYLGKDYWTSDTSVGNPKRVSYNHNTTTAYHWWLRSGADGKYNNGNACVIMTGGGLETNTGVTASLGVRPAFVLQL